MYNKLRDVSTPVLAQMTAHVAEHLTRAPCVTSLQGDFSYSTRVQVISESDVNTCDYVLTQMKNMNC